MNSNQPLGSKSLGTFGKWKSNQFNVGISRKLAAINAPIISELHARQHFVRSTNICPRNFFSIVTPAFTEHDPVTLSSPKTHRVVLRCNALFANVHSSEMPSSRSRLPVAFWSSPSQLTRTSVEVANITSPSIGCSIPFISNIASLS